MSDDAVAHPNQGRLERGHVRLDLIRDLAANEHSQAELARRLDVSYQAVQAFARRHAEEIASVAAHIDQEFAGLWAADKRARIAECQQLVEDIERLTTDDEVRANVNYAEVARTKLAALKQIAEELGQLPGRVSVTHSGSLSVQLNGVDVAALT